MNSMKKKMSYKEWLAKYGYEDCAGCEFNDIRHARCTYPGKWCVIYVRYRKDSE